jgi:hypothetical protein
MPDQPTDGILEKFRIEFLKCLGAAAEQRVLPGSAGGVAGAVPIPGQLKRRNALVKMILAQYS